GEADRDPLDAIHFGKLPHLPRTAWPFELEHVALGPGGIEVGLKCPHRDAFPARLTQLPEEDGIVVRHLQTRFLLELPEGCSERVLLLVVLPLGDGPRAVALPLPERPARVRDENLD